MNKLSAAKRVQVVAALVEGTSLRATSRMTGVARMTIEKLLRDLADACMRYQDEHLRNLSCRRIQCDEIWAFVYSKDKNIPAAMQGDPGVGSVWTWTAIDADSKLVVSWRVGDRGAATANDFMLDVAGRLRNRIQLTTDGHKVYLAAVEDAFGADVDYAVLQKVYGSDPDGEKRYSPAKILSSTAEVIRGEPNPKHISTSYVERHNLTIRMSTRRFTRLTNAFSKKVEMHIAAVALTMMYYNFVRIHQTLRITPAMAAGVTDHLWDVADIINLLEEKVADARHVHA